MKKLILYLILFLFIPFSAWGATYYIDATSGSNNNNGTSHSTPWEHSPWMNGCDGTGCGNYSYSDGDKFLYKCGEEWSDRVRMTTDNQDNITHAAYYGSGTEGVSGDKPKFTNYASQTATFSITGDDIDGLTIQNLWIDNSLGSSNETCISVNSHLADDLTIDSVDMDGRRGLYIWHVRGITITNNYIGKTAPLMRSGVYIGGVIGFPRSEQAQDGTIENNIVRSYGSEGLTTHAGQFNNQEATATGSTTTLIDTSEFDGYADDDLIGHGIRIDGETRRYVTDWDQSTRTFTFAPALTYDTYSGLGYDLDAIPDGNFTFRRNYVSNNSESCFDVSSHGTTLIEENRLYDCAEGGLNLWHDCGVVIARYNFIEDCGDDNLNKTCIDSGDYASTTDRQDYIYGNICTGSYSIGFKLNSQISGDIYVYNNIFALDRNESGTIAGMYVDGGFDGTTNNVNVYFKNNIVHNNNSSSDTLMRFSNADEGGLPGDNVHLDNNQYYDADGTQADSWIFDEDASAYSGNDTLAEVVSEFGEESNSAWGDPDLGNDGETTNTAIAAERFYLQSDSPCINEGVFTRQDMSMLFDPRSDLQSTDADKTIWKKSMNSCSPWDIGAFVYLKGCGTSLF